MSPGVERLVEGGEAPRRSSLVAQSASTISSTRPSSSPMYIAPALTDEAVASNAIQLAGGRSSAARSERRLADPVLADEQDGPAAGPR